MIRKLRTKLIMVSMLSLLIVLIIIIGGINLISYQGIVDDADSVLDLLSLNKGHFPPVPSDVEWQETGPRFQSPELMFEIRFFSALINSDGELLSADIEKIAAVDTDRVAEYAGQVHQQNRSRGFIGNYRFIQYEEDENIRIIFLDCGRMLAGFKAVLLGSAGIAFVGSIAVFLLILLLSGLMIRPVAIAHEKQKQFITDAGHELKTPVTIIKADAELLEMEFGQNEWLDDIHAQALRLSTLTNDLISLSRLEEAEKMPFIEFPISDLISETAAAFQSIAITQQKQFSLDIQPMLSYRGNEKSLGQLVSILLDNALKYSNDNGSITLSFTAQHNALVLTVSNTVDFISAETIRRIFDRFYRGDPSRTSASSGYGIGLSIAKAIVASHKGKISAEASTSKCFTVTVKLPV